MLVSISRGLVVGRGLLRRIGRGLRGGEWLLLGLSFGLLAAGCSRSKPAGDAAGGPVVAQVGDRVIRAEDLVNEARRRAESRRPVPLKEELLRELIEREALVARARAAGIDRDPTTQREFESLLIRKLQAAELDPRREALTVSDADVKAAYDAQPERYQRPAQVRMAMLYLAADAKASAGRRAEVRARLEEARSQFAEMQGRKAVLSEAGGPVPVGFGALAVQYSDDQVTRHRGGDLGWFEAGKHPARVPTPVMEAGLALAPGQQSEVLEAKDGFYVMLKADARAASMIPFESVAASLRQSLLVQRRKELDEQFRADTARQVPSQVHTEALAAVTLPETSSVLVSRSREPQPPGLPGSTESQHGN